MTSLSVAQARRARWWRARLAENPSATVLLLEAGPNDDMQSVIDASQHGTNIGGPLDWGFRSEPNTQLNGRRLLLTMGKVLGGGSSINAMVWARGHRSDWDFFAAEAGDFRWGYDSVLAIYTRIEDWHGLPDPEYRGVGGRRLFNQRPTPAPWPSQHWRQRLRSAYRHSRMRTVA
jgi:choline dehydrogenase